ncbi:hypothetical protein [Mycobacterium sp. C31M]
MESVLLSAHVVAGILFVGPVAVATSLFPRYAAAGDGMAVAAALHRITRIYGALAVIVPIVGIALAIAQGRASEIWVLIAMVLTGIAGGLLVVGIAPLQRAALGDGDPRRRQLGMITGIFNLLWAVVVVLMIVRPGSEYA